MKKILVEFALVIMVALWGLSFSLTKPLLGDFGVFNFLALRFVLGSLAFLAIMYKSRQLKFNQETIMKGLLSGVLLFSAFFCHIYGLKYTSIAKNAFIVGSSLIFIPGLMKWFYGTRANTLTYIQTALALLGLGMVTILGVHDGINQGDLVTFIGTFIYALYTVYVEKTVRNQPAETFTVVQLITVGLMSTLFSLAFEDFQWPQDPGNWLVVLFLAIVLTGGFYYALSKIQQILDASPVTVIFTLEPFFASVFGWWLLGEMVSLYVFLGGMIIFISVILPYMSIVNPKKVVS